MGLVAFVAAARHLAKECRTIVRGVSIEQWREEAGGPAEALVDPRGQGRPHRRDGARAAHLQLHAVDVNRIARIAERRDVRHAAAG